MADSRSLLDIAARYVRASLNEGYDYLGGPTPPEMDPDVIAAEFDTALREYVRDADTQPA